MIERDQAVVKADLAIGQFQVVHGAARKPGFKKIFEVIAPISETTAQRKRHVGFVRQFVARDEIVNDAPGVSVLRCGTRGPSRMSRQFTTRAKRTNG